MGSFTRSSAPFRLIVAQGAARTYAERIADEAESAADAADQVTRKIARHGKASRKVSEHTRSNGGAR